jgi:hypothetical protein
VFIVTKQESGGRLYRSNLTQASPKQTLTLEYLQTVPFSVASAGSISPDGAQIVIRREDFALMWNRCDNETVATALSRLGQAVPVVGPPLEPNGEGIDFLPNGQGYVTISEGLNPVIYSFSALCPMAPLFTSSLTNQTNFASRSVRFSATAVGRPAPGFLWQFNGQPLSGQTNDSLILSNLTVAQTGTYELIASNSAGSATNAATLVVLTRPALRITEAQSSENSSSGVPTADWWELTSFESESVDLSGYRFNDSNGGLSDPYTIPDGVTIAPGESMVWVEDLTPAQFRVWWGATNLPVSLQIVTYHGSGLALSAAGDSVQLWDNLTTDPNDTVARADFGPATTGVTFSYDPATGQFGTLSQVNVNGAFRAPITGDVGSPGRIRQPPPTPQLTFALADDALRIEFSALGGYRYSLETRSDLGSESWQPTGDVWTPMADTIISVSESLLDAVRFYRVTAD